MVNATPWPLYPRERDPVPILQKAGRSAGPVWMGAENFAPTGIRSRDRPVAIPTELPWPAQCWSADVTTTNILTSQHFAAYSKQYNSHNPIFFVIRTSGHCLGAFRGEKLFPSIVSASRFLPSLCFACFSLESYFILMQPVANRAVWVLCNIGRRI
jgi:hypothetical protein